MTTNNVYRLKFVLMTLYNFYPRLLSVHGVRNSCLGRADWVSAFKVHSHCLTHHFKNHFIKEFKSLKQSLHRQISSRG